MKGKVVASVFCVSGVPLFTQAVSTAHPFKNGDLKYTQLLEPWTTENCCQQPMVACLRCRWSTVSTQAALASLRYRTTGAVGMPMGQLKV